MDLSHSGSGNLYLGDTPIELFMRRGLIKCFNRFSVPLVSNPSLRSFLHTVCQRFCQSSEPCSNSLVYLYCSKDGGERSWGGVGEDLSLNMYFFTDRPAQTILLNPFHYTATKSPFTSLEITMGQDKIYGWSAHSALGPC